MPRRVYYRITDRSDGLFDAVVRIEPDRIIRRDGFASLAEAETWADGLRILMAALGAPLLHEDAQTTPAADGATAPVEPETVRLLDGDGPNR